MQISLLRMPSLLALGFYNLLLKEMANRNDIAISYSSNNNLHAAYLHVEGVAFSKPSLICLLVKDNIFGFNYGEEEGVYVPSSPYIELIDIPNIDRMCVSSMSSKDFIAFKLEIPEYCLEMYKNFLKGEYVKILQKQAGLPVPSLQYLLDRDVITIKRFNAKLRRTLNTTLDDVELESFENLELPLTMQEVCLTVQERSFNTIFTDYDELAKLNNFKND